MTSVILVLLVESTIDIFGLLLHQLLNTCNLSLHSNIFLTGGWRRRPAAEPQYLFSVFGGDSNPLAVSRPELLYELPDARRLSSFGIAGSVSHLLVQPDGATAPCCCVSPAYFPSIFCTLIICSLGMSPRPIPSCICTANGLRMLSTPREGRRNRGRARDRRTGSRRPSAAITPRSSRGIWIRSGTSGVSRRASLAMIESCWQ